jgi:archaellum component FlaD/FlaE
MDLKTFFSRWLKTNHQLRLNLSPSQQMGGHSDRNLRSRQQNSDQLPTQSAESEQNEQNLRSRQIDSSQQQNRESRSRTQMLQESQKQHNLRSQSKSTTQTSQNISEKDNDRQNILQTSVENNSHLSDALVVFENNDLKLYVVRGNQISMYVTLQLSAQHEYLGASF